MDIVNKTKCAKCGIRPEDMSDLTMGEFSPNRKWFCFEHVDDLFKLCSRDYGKNIETTSQYWDYLDEKHGGSSRPK